MEQEIKYDELEIIRRVHDNEYYEVNICKSYENNKPLYTVICLKDLNLFKEEVKLFSQLREKKRFTDFVTCFSRNSMLYVLFIYQEEAPVQFEELYEKTSKEKADFIKAVLSCIVVLDIPEVMLWDILSKENINIDKSGKVYLNYFLKSAERYTQCGSNRYMKKLSSMLWEIFNEEIDENKLPKLKLMIDKLNNEAYSGVMDIYLEFVSFYDEFDLCETVESDKDKSFINRIKKKINSIKDKWGFTIVTLILSAAVAMFIVMVTAEKQPKNISEIEKIGTREIK